MTITRSLCPAAALVFILVCMQGAFVFAEEIYVGANASPKKIFVGDRVDVRVWARYVSGTHVRFPDYPDHLIGDLEIKDQGKRMKRGVFGLGVDERSFVITSYAVGKHTIPPFEVRYQLKDTREWAVKKTAAITIVVESVLPRGRVLADIKDVKGPLGFFEVPWVLIGCVLSVFCLVLLVILWIGNRPAPLRAPHEVALLELMTIQGLLATGIDVKDYYVKISDTIRRYIESSFRVRAPEMTTEEFLNSIRGRASLRPEEHALLQAFLSACDMVKFARYSPGRAEVDSVFVTAKQFVEQTRPLETGTAQGSPAGEGKGGSV